MKIKLTKHKRLEITKRWAWKERVIGIDRFGGGWTWKIGIQGGGSSVIISLLFGSFRFSIREIY